MVNNFTANSMEDNIVYHSKDNDNTECKVFYSLADGEATDELNNKNDSDDRHRVSTATASSTAYIGGTSTNSDYLAIISDEAFTHVSNHGNANNIDSATVETFFNQESSFHQLLASAKHMRDSSLSTADNSTTNIYSEVDEATNYELTNYAVILDH